MELADFLGITAGALTTISLIPQTVKVLKTRHTTDLSLATYAILTMGIATWFAYGITIGAWPVIIANAICIPLSGTILVMKILEKKD